MAQVARIGGQLLQDNLLRELSDLKFDNDLLVVKRDNTLGINTTTTPRNLTINGTLRTASGTSDPDIIFDNSLKIGDLTLATTGISTASGNININSTHPEGYITTNGIGSYKFAVKGDGLIALGTNDSVGLRSEVYDGQTLAWNTNGNYGNYWYPGPKISADSPPNDGDRLYDDAIARAQAGTWTDEELVAFDFDGDGDIQVDDALKILTMNTQFINGTAFPASRTLADHPNPEAFKAYVKKYYPRSAPRELQIQSGGTVTVTGNIHATGNITYGAEQVFEGYSLWYTVNNPNAYGTDANDHFGQTVAVDGNFGIIGAPDEDSASFSSEGKAYIYNITTGQLLHTLANPDAGASNTQFGDSVHISGNYAIVGASTYGNNEGRAYIFDVTTGSLLHTLTNPNTYGTSQDDNFGQSVSISGTFCAVGARLEDEVTGNNSGVIYVFNNSTGALEETIKNPNVYGTVANDYFGTVVSIDGNNVAASALGEDTATDTEVGVVYIFNASTGALSRTLQNPNTFSTSTDDRFGEAISLSGNKIIVGAPGEDEPSNSNAGKAYIFNVTTGTLLLTLSNPNDFGTSQDDQFGSSVDISGTWAIVGTPGEDTASFNSSGIAYVFNTNTGLMVSKVTNPNPGTDHKFAFNVGINNDAHTIIGAPLETVDGSTEAGRVYIHQATISGSESSLIIGDDSTDTASFFADFKSDIIPDQTDTFTVGLVDKRFRLAVEELTADRVEANGIVYQGIELTKNVGVIFVSTNNGNDANEGTNPGGPFATITKALSTATRGDLIYIYPGQYQESFPMTVPEGVTIQGSSLRDVEITPTSATQSNDAFLLNSGATIENITVKDFYFNSGANTGYAFRFANNFSTNIFEQTPGRSPYIRNVSVITKGTTTSPSDPRGFASGDAGKGALVDGSVVAQNSRSASMLFHSVTFITPGVDAITCTNGVRVEWLNSFTYFANRGLYLTQGTGRLLPDSTIEYGAEIRSIASASIYGNKGIEADGENCLAYLINYNFAYIGTGKDVTNDNTLAIQANEVIELNNAKVYYTGQDQKGNFRVGDNFLVDLENERTSFDIESIFATNVTALIRNGNDVITIQPSQINLDNIVIAGNTIEATRSNLNIDSVGVINLQGNVVTPSMNVSGNLTVGGSINNIGDSPTDTVDFNMAISQDFLPGNSDGLTLGNGNKRWKELYTDAITTDSMHITTSAISTNESNADLNILASGTGAVFIDNLQFEDNKIIGKFDPEGLFVVNASTDPGFPSIFNGYDSLRSLLPKWTTIFGIPVLGTATASVDAVKHAANMLASYLDNNFDGVVDNNALYAEFSDGLFAIVVYANAAEETSLTAQLGAFKVNRTFSVFEDEMNNFLGDGVGNQRDLASEKILKDLLIPRISNLHIPLSTTRPSTVTNAMDAARGGYQAGGTPGYNYPPFAWYTDPTGLTYTNLVYEYLYLLTASVAGSLEWRSGTITSLWDPYNDVLLQIQDVAGRNIIIDNTYGFPITNSPSIDYWTEVTNVLGGTKRDVTFAPNDTLKIDAISDLSLPKGTSAERPAVQGGIRFNNIYNTFEGTEVTGAVSLDGIYDTDRNTYLDLSNNQFNFVTNGQTNHTLNGILLESGGFSSDHKFSIDGNVVSNDVESGNSILRSNGTGFTKIQEVHFQDSNLHNASAANFIFNLTNSNGRAFLKIDNVSGMVIPQGTTLERPSSPEIGHTRYNLTLEYVETWNGTSWINAAGEVESIEANDVEELAYIYNLILD